LTELKTIRVPSRRLNELLLQRGDILFNEGGDLDKLGRGWIWSNEVNRCIHQNHVFRARLHDRTFEPKFFSFYGNTRGYDYFVRFGKQTTNLASINKSILTAMPVVVPSAEEQQEIIRRLDNLFHLADSLDRCVESAKEKVRLMSPSILQRAFAGRLLEPQLQECH
jgi:type I restriction enzyme S subunit